MEQVIIEQHEGWVKLTLNRPEAKNALNTAVLARVAEALTAAAADPAVRAAMVQAQLQEVDPETGETLDLLKLEDRLEAEKVASHRQYPAPLLSPWHHKRPKRAVWFGIRHGLALRIFGGR